MTPTDKVWPSAAETNDLIHAIAELEELTGKEGVEILKRLMATHTLTGMGCDGSGVMTRDEVLAATRICRHWSDQARERTKERNQR